MVLLGLLAGAARAEDYRHYVLTSDDFRYVTEPDAETLNKRWNEWVLMPWRHRWPRPYGDELAGKMAQAGFNGGACDFVPRNDATLHDKYGFLWYLDHAAGKGVLHLPDKWNTGAYLAARRRPRCLLDPDFLDQLRGRLARSVRLSMKYPTRIAYALDDEISWSTLTNPCRWDNHPLSVYGFRAWLSRRYGNRGAILRQWGRGTDGFLHRMATPDDFQHLYRRPISVWNLSPWCDSLSYMDSQLLNLVGELVTYANAIDPSTPCGIVGAQGPAAYGGYDYAKLMRKVQFLEVYNIGAAMEIVRSFNERLQIPLVASGTGDPTGPDGVWWNWYGLAHGFRGTIVFADNWFAPTNDKMHLGPEIQKLASASRKLLGAKWLHDGVAIYYSQPSIQVGWFIDCQVHGRTWIKRLSSMNNRLASSNAAFWAWTRLLEDSRLQYNFVSYADMVTKGLDPKQYKVLILPRVLALSDEEVEKLTTYVEQGGVVLADHMAGLFDQHGRGRREPALDSLIGLKNHPPVMAGNVFGGTALTEFDAEGYWNSKFYQAAAEIWPKCLRARGLPVAERQIGQFIAGRHNRGWAMLMNVSLAEYCLHRVRQSPRADKIRKTIASILNRAGVEPWLTLRAGKSGTRLAEATYWERDGRRYVCVVSNPLRLGGVEGPEDSSGPKPESLQKGVKRGTMRLTIETRETQRNVVDEIAGKPLGDGRRFELDWKTDEAAIISMDANPLPASTSRPATTVEKSGAR